MINRHDLPQLLFQGASDQEKAAEKNYNQVSAYNPTVKNRYDGMQLFGYDKMKTAVDDYTKAGSKVIKQNTADNVKEAGASTAAAGQSRGYGGSILEDMVAKAKNKSATGGTSALRDLMLKRMQMQPGMMQQDNANQFAKTGGAQGVDFQNVQNMFSKFGMQGNALQGLDDGGWLTDTMAVLNTAGKLAPLIAAPFTGGTSMAAMASDRRFKENIKYVGDSPRGVGIYEFNYKGIPQKYRGAMAQENLFASIEINGMLYLDYSKIDVKFEAI